MKERLTYLFLQYYRNECTRKELEEFFHYVNSSRHDQELHELIRQVYNEIKQAHPSFTYIDKDGKLIPTDTDWYMPEKEPGRLSRKKTILVAVSVALLALCGTITWQVLKPRVSEVVPRALTRKFSERSEHKYLLLSDSTQVWLNAASTLEYPESFAPDKREVHLTGEAYFDVKHADKLPFIIHTGEVTTTVLGTAFNIKAYEDQRDIEVAVRRGKVSVSKGGKHVATLVKGQKIKISHEDSANKELRNLDTEHIGTWQQGYLVYQEETMQEIVSDLGRTYNIEIIIKDGKTAETVITTSFNRDIGAKKALEILCKLTDTRLVIQDSGYIIQ